MAVDHRISPLKKSDLQFQYTPAPSATDDPAKRGAPDSALLNRHQWYEVLYFVNKFANECGKESREIALKAERLIKHHLPSNQRSHQHVQDWLIENWKTYPNV